MSSDQSDLATRRVTAMSEPVQTVIPCKEHEPHGDRLCWKCEWKLVQK